MSFCMCKFCAFQASRELTDENRAEVIDSASDLKVSSN